MTISNSGDVDASSVSVYYTIGGAQQTLQVGDIPSSSSAQATIPFQISPSATNGIQLVTIVVYYSYVPTSTSQGHQSAQQGTFTYSLPLVINQYNTLDVGTASGTQLAVAPGGEFTAQLQITNNGGIANNVIITSPSNSTFYLEGSAQDNVGVIPQNSTANVSLVMASSSSLPFGSYGVPLTITYQDSLNQPVNEQVTIGPVSVVDPSMLYQVSLTPLGPAEIGSAAPFQISIENGGTTPISGDVAINSTDIFTPVGTGQVYFSDVPPQSTILENVTVGILSTASAGYYTLPIALETTSGLTADYNPGVSVSATPAVTVTSDDSTGTPEIDVTNTGDTQIRSTYVLVSPATGRGPTTNTFLGTLNVDDYGSAPIPASFGNETMSAVNVLITFKDSSNIQHTVNETVSLAGTTSRTSTRVGFAGGAGGAGGLFRSSGGSSSFIVPIIILVVVIVAGYLVYRKFFSKPKIKPINAKTETSGKKQGIIGI
jgi:hypothetical protein